MKTPERMFTEYFSDSISCFHGHKATWKDFESCCEIFRVDNFGIYPCFWKILLHKGFDAQKIKALDAAIRILKMELCSAAIKYGRKLSERVAEKYARFFNPHHLLFYESVEEVQRNMPSVEKDIMEVVPDDAPLHVAEKCYREIASTRLLSFRHVLNVEKLPSLSHLNEEYALTTIDNKGVRKAFRVSPLSFIEYLGTLLEKKVKRLEIEEKQVMEFGLPPASFRIVLADGSRCNLLLYSLVTFECLGI